MLAEYIDLSSWQLGTVYDDGSDQLMRGRRAGRADHRAGPSWGNGREAAIGRKSAPSSYQERPSATHPRALGLQSSRSGDFPEGGEPALSGHDHPGKHSLGAFSAQELPGPRLKAEISAGRSLLCCAPSQLPSRYPKLDALEIAVEETDPEPYEVVRFTGSEGVEQQINLVHEPHSHLHHVCVYPEAPALVNRVARSRYEGRPFLLRLALGEPQLAFEKFDLTVLEHYRNDPRYHWRANDVGGFISVHDEYAVSGDMPESEQALLQTFGFCYDENLNRCVAVFIRYLANLSPEHQRIWQAKIVPGEYWLHPDYARTSDGDWPERLSIFDAFLMELEHINARCGLMSKPPLFREAPRDFAFLLRPTVKEFQDFVSLLDKLISDNLNKSFCEIRSPPRRWAAKP